MKMYVANNGVLLIVPLCVFSGQYGKTGFTTLEWQEELQRLKFRYGEEAFYLNFQVAVILNDKFLGGPKELIKTISKDYNYHISPDYPKESVDNFVRFVKASGRPCAFLHIAIDSEHIGTMIFMLYVDICPKTVDNFLRLCSTTRGGYSGTPIHRIVKDSWVQCGGFNLKSTDLACENFIVPHDRRGVLCMANADRDVDCSTQFFILLQPQPWMVSRYVAFGQLIDGASVLTQIEKVPTWYESPTREIIIHHAGVLNLECQDIVVNPSAREYIQSHIENLTELGNNIWQYLMEKVDMEIEFIMLQRAPEGILGEGEGTSVEIASKSTPPLEELKTQRMKTTARTGSDENNDFDVDSYEENEEYSIETTVPTSSVPPPPEVPYYIPLTDVLYPSETDSTYDLKKFLKGDYCHEKDLKPDKREPFVLPLHKIRRAPSVISNPDIELDSEDEREIRAYISENVDKVSFAGDHLIDIAKKYGHDINVKKARRKSNKLMIEEISKVLPAKHMQSDEAWIYKPSDFMISGTHLNRTEVDEVPEASVFAQLFQQVINTESTPPTLKNYKTLQEIQDNAETYNILKASPYYQRLLKAVDSKDKFSRNLGNIDTLSLVYGKTIGRRISTDYATAVDRINKNHKVSIRTLEYAKTRPGMTVEAYKERNRQLLQQNTELPAVGDGNYVPIKEVYKATKFADAISTKEV